MMDPSTRPLRLLSLDGGGVRGLSSIMILKHLMRRINERRADTDKLEPWQAFDMIGGTSTGGIIAIMLGRLRMTVDACEKAYEDLSREIFSATSSESGFVGYFRRLLLGKGSFLEVHGRFNELVLEDVIKRTIRQQRFSEDLLLKDEDTDCRVFVVAVRENNSEAAVMRSYKHPKAAESLYNECKAWQACRATSAATSFFNPITIGRKGQTFLDGGLLYNNPVGVLHQEAEALWPDRDSLIVSIGTGETPGTAFKGNVLNIVKALKNIAVETEKTAHNFYRDHKNMVNDKRYYRFNVIHGLANIGLEEFRQSATIADTTETYLDGGEVGKKFDECVERMLQIDSEVSLNIRQLRDLDRKEKEDRDKFVRWLAPIDFLQKQKDVAEVRYEKTGLWLLETDEFKQWLDTDKVLWCRGMPGAGKTTLVSMLVDYLRSTTFWSKDKKEKEKVGVACSYCDYKLAKMQTPENLLASLWKDLAVDNGDLSSAVKEVRNKNEGRMSRPSLKEVTSALHAEIGRYTKVFIILDALDECSEGGQFRDHIVNALLNLPGNAKLLITSRENVDVEDMFKDVTRLDIRATESDLRAYLEGQLYRLNKTIREGPNGTILQKMIVDTITNRANGMFLLAKLHLDAILPLQTRRDMDAALKNMPKGADALRQTYNEALGRIEDQDSVKQATAKRIISWILCVQRPLTVDELRHSLAVDPDDEELDQNAIRDSATMIGCCAGLVKIDKASTVIDFVHSTTQSYFEDIQEEKFPDAQEDIVKTCLTYLLFRTFSDGPCADDDSMGERLRESLFLHYAAHHWGHHAREDRKNIVETLILAFLKETPNLTAAVQVMHISQSNGPGHSQLYPREVQGLWVAAFFGLAKVVQLLIGQHADCTALTSYGENSLHIASRNGHPRVVELLLATNRMEVDTRNTNDETELHVAAAGGHTDVVRLLLDKGALIEAENNLGQTALYLAAANGHDAAVNVLMERGANALVADRDGTTALNQASWRGHDTVVYQILLTILEIGVDTREPSFMWALEDLLMRYVRRDKRDDRLAVKQLLQAGADDRCRALCAAAETGNVGMAKLFLDNGDDVNSGAGVGGMRPLHYAASAGHVKMVEFLVKNGADVTIKDDHYGRNTALTCVYNGYADADTCDKIKKILVDTGADPADAHRVEMPYFQQVTEAERLEDAKRRHTENLKSHEPELEAVRRLVEDAHDMEQRSDIGRTALHTAADDGNILIVQYLLDHKADVNARDDDGITPLHLSCISDGPAIADLLVQAGANLELRMERVDGTTDKSGGTPLHWACIVGSVGSIAILLEAGAEVEARTAWYRTPLHLAVRFGHIEAARLLLAQGADLEARRDTNETPLHFAVEEQLYDMVEFLLEQGADTEAKGDRGTPLHRATRTGQKKIMELLNDAGKRRK